MKHSRIISLFALVLATFSSCSHQGSLTDSGISKRLADFRTKTYSEVKYSLEFDIPRTKTECIPSSEVISLELAKKTDIILDFSASDKLSSVSVNGQPADYQLVNNHIVIPKSQVVKGENTLTLAFEAGELSLNRRDDFLYTLLVPARAHTLFPCFDQPDMKAQYSLTLEVPDSWIAVSNSPVVSESGNGRRTVKFAPTEPLSTYLFAFVAGEFQKVTAEKDGRVVSMYHRETDPAKIAQCPAILDLVFDSLEYVEDYTSCPYPFAKYELIAIPDFQYGGMEHTGATLYNDNSIFLGENPTTAELLNRASLIAHETAHMWFGDLVTMRWFDDVWTKEVFANWFAAKMARPSFPEINHVLGDLRNLYASSYSEDRTQGSNAIQRPLNNLSNAGLIYCNIIYDKAPIAMDMLARKMGAENFRQGIKEYVQEYAYSNASWDDLIEILNRHADFDVSEWSRVWIKEPGMPIYHAKVEDGVIVVNQEDPFGRGNYWPQDVKYEFAREGEKVFAIPNTDGLGYGYFVLEEDVADYIYRHWLEYDETAKMSLLMTFYENVLRGNLPKDRFLTWTSQQIFVEGNPLIDGSLLSYGSSIYQRGCSNGAKMLYCSALREIASEYRAPSELRLLCFRQFMHLAQDEAHCEELYSIWKDRHPYRWMILSERDYTSLAYELMIRFPERYDEIHAEAASRISNPDRLETFLFVSKAASPDKASRDALFESFSDAQNRRPESRVLSALALLNHPLRREDAIGYIRPSLDLLPEIQQTGDIFFPASWCRAVLSGQYSEEAMAVVDEFLKDNKGLEPLLLTKVKHNLL